MRKVLVDSNIFLDYYLDRKDNLLPLGEFAFQFINKALECRYFVIVCREAVEEICFNLGISEKEVFKKIFNGLMKKHKMEIIDPSPELKRKARAISENKKIPFNDALFAVVAKEKGVPVITRDKHFAELNYIVETIKPEELD